jgi:hypothetical protein
MKNKLGMLGRKMLYFFAVVLFRFWLPFSSLCVLATFLTIVIFMSLVLALLFCAGTLFIVLGLMESLHIMWVIPVSVGIAWVICFVCIAYTYTPEDKRELKEFVDARLAVLKEFLFRPIPANQ